jgi:hypothetical protein
VTTNGRYPAYNKVNTRSQALYNKGQGPEVSPTQNQRHIPSNFERLTALITEAVTTSEASTSFYQPAWRNIPEDIISINVPLTVCNAGIAGTNMYQATATRPERNSDGSNYSSVHLAAAVNFNQQVKKLSAFMIREALDYTDGALSFHIQLFCTGRGVNWKTFVYGMPTGLTICVLD